jgi:hypothetical protein
MMAALIVISVLALAGACFPTTTPCISNLRQRVAEAYEQPRTRKEFHGIR